MSGQRLEHIAALHPQWRAQCKGGDGVQLLMSMRHCRGGSVQEIILGVKQVVVGACVVMCSISSSCSCGVDLCLLSTMLQKSC